MNSLTTSPTDPGLHSRTRRRNAMSVMPAIGASIQAGSTTSPPTSSRRGATAHRYGSRGWPRNAAGAAATDESSGSGRHAGAHVLVETGPEAVPEEDPP